MGLAASAGAPPPPHRLRFLLLALLIARWGAEAALSGPHIADLNVLLPPRMTNPVEYRLQGSGGCFSWSWDHHDILVVDPEYNSTSQCSTSARLISIAPYAGRQETSVYARDVRTGSVIRCEVFIDRISRIRIFHHSVKLDLEGLATLHIHAFDEQDNVFSSLVGVKFLWELSANSVETEGMHHLLHIPLKESPLSDCIGFCGGLETRIKLEDEGVASDLYVVKGIGIGRELVSAKLLEPQFEDLSDAIVITVAELMSIDPPSPVYVTKGTIINYNLRIIRLNTPHVIDLPSPYHRWSVVNASVALVDNARGTAQALNVGSTDIIVEDIRVSGNDQTSSFHVVVPDKLVMYILPVTYDSNTIQWLKFSTPVVCYVFLGEEYIIHVKAFSREYNFKDIFLTESNDLHMESSTSKYWDIDSVPGDVDVAYSTGNSWLFKPVFEGRGFLSASLKIDGDSLDTTKVVRVDQEVVVCSKVQLSRLEQDDVAMIIRLPWAPGVFQEVQLNAHGGCGKTAEDYHWYSSDSSIIFVSTLGFARSELPGQAIIKVVSKYDPRNYVEVTIEASVPFSMFMQPSFPVEVVLGAELQAAVTFKTYYGDYYHQCDAFNSFINWKVISGIESFSFLDNTRGTLGADLLSHGERYIPRHGPACAWVFLYASRAGHAELHATLSSKLTSTVPTIDGPGILKASLTIAAYSPLFACQAGNGNKFGGYWVNTSNIHAELHEPICPGFDELFLVPGSATDILLLGGPEPWDQRVEHIDKLEVVDDHNQSVGDVVLVQQASGVEKGLYNVLCLSLGSSKLRFSRGNLVGDDHPLPAVEYLYLSVFCSLPSAIVLIGNEPANTFDKIEAAIRADHGPGQVRSSPLVVANGCTIRVAAVGIHAGRRPFANSSSLFLEWELKGCEMLAHWNEANNYNSSIYSWERFLVLQNSSGTCTVRARAIGFCEDFMKSSVMLDTSVNTLTDAIRLQLVSSLRVVPEFVLLVFDPEAKVNLSILGGTCFLDATTNDTYVINISQPSDGSQCLHLTVGASGLGVASVTVRDIGFSPPASASALVKVANVDWVKAVPEGKISLMEGSIKSFDIVAGTNEGHVFDSSQYAHMSIQLHLADGILAVTHSSNSSVSGGYRIYGPQFSVRAVDIGTTTIYVSVRQHSGNEIFSPPIKVEVYKLLQVHPEYIYLVPGASYVLAVRGGPKDGVSVEYSSMNVGMVTVEQSSGSVTAISLGNATVRASVFGSGGTVICEAYVSIEVGIPSTLNLSFQSNQLCVGCKMPIFPSFLKGDLFSFYEVCMGYMWMIDDEKVIRFDVASQNHLNVHEALLFLPETKNSPLNDSVGFMNVLLGRSAGKTKVSISLNCEFIMSGTPQKAAYDAFEYFHVIRDPPLALGIPITMILPPFYTTSHLLPMSPVTYGHSDSQERDIVVYSVLKMSSWSDTSRQDAVCIAGNAIMTKESNNLACILAKDQATGRSEIASCVRVADVAQVRAMVTESSSKTVHLPVNAEVELAVNYCDFLGYTFYEAVSVVQLDVDTNYPDIVSFLKRKDGNNTEKIILQARSPGRALVKVSINHKPFAADYLLVSVGAQIFPNNPTLHVGHHLIFSLSGDGVNDADSGWWLSSDEAVLYINKKSGEAHARGEGVAYVFFKGSTSDFRTVVTVTSIGQIIVIGPEETLTNVPFPTTGYRFSLSLSDAFDNKFDASESPYNCKVDPPYVGIAKPWYDHSMGKACCLFFPYSPTHLFKSMSESKGVKNGEGFLHVSVTAYLKEATHVAGSARALFVGGFFIPEISKLNLTPAFNRSLITVIGNTDLEIQWTAKDLLLVQRRGRNGYGIGNSAEFEVKVLAEKQFTDKIVFSLPATGQTMVIDVNYNNDANYFPRRDNGSGGTSVLWTAIFACMVVLIITIVISLWLLDKPGRSATARDPVATPSVPSSSSAGAAAESSPRTPQRFSEYLRRTVDETPYYKRNGRRRFDPQYTY